MKKDPHAISDRQLRSLLKGLREDVAAPAGFRQAVMQRLQAEGLVAAPPRPQAPSLRERVSAWMSPARLGLGLGAALALAFAWSGLGRLDEAAKPSPTPAAVSAAPAPVVARASKPQRASVVAARRSTAPVVAAAPLVRQAESIHPAQAPAVGLSQDSGVQQSMQVYAASDKPGIIVVKPSPTPLSKPVAGDSQVRNNVLRASRGEAALILFKVRQAGHVRVDIFDRLGRPVAVLSDGDRSAGDYSLNWTGTADNGGMAASGLYVVRVQAPGYEARHKVLLIK